MDTKNGKFISHGDFIQVILQVFILKKMLQKLWVNTILNINIHQIMITSIE